MLAAWQGPLQCRCHCTTTLLPFCHDCAGFGAVSTWLIVLFFIFINLGSLAARQAAAMPLPLMQLCCCISPLAARQHLLPTSTPQHHDAFSINPSPGRCVMLGVMVVGVVAWCCCCNQQRCLVLLLLPVSVSFPLPFPSTFLAHRHPLPSTFQSVAITVAVHCHRSHHPLTSLPPSLSTVAITVDHCHHC